MMFVSASPPLPFKPGWSISMRTKSSLVCEEKQLKKGLVLMVQLCLDEMMSIDPCYCREKASRSRDMPRLERVTQFKPFGVIIEKKT